MKNITYKKIIIISCIISIILGILLHNVYKLTNNNVVLGMFVPVNESTWEHLKLILIPFTLFSLFFYFYTKRKVDNIFLLTLFGNIIGMFLTVVLFYIGNRIFKRDLMIYNIIVYIISMISAFYVFYLGLYNKDFKEETKNTNLIGAIALSLLFTAFILNSYFPFKSFITRDPITNSYGININAYTTKN